MSRASRSAGSCVTAAVTPSSASAAMGSRRPGFASSRWLRRRSAAPACWQAGAVESILYIGETRRTKEHSMDVGMMMVFASYGWDDCSDARVWDEEIRLARLAADLGFDCLWSAEHHFNDYSFVPDNLQLMTYLTALCPNIDLGTAAVILPWHDPLRVAEQV